MLSYQVIRRRYEVAVRLSLGAVPADVARRIVGRGMLLAGMGLLLGLVLTTILSRLMASVVFGISVTDFVSMAGAVALVAMVAFAACYVPAKRAAKTNPMEVLRAE